MIENANRYIGCCGAYCRTCKPYIEEYCKGCKLGFDTGERDIKRAKCKIKICCFRDKKFDTCADCKDLDTCPILGGWYAKNGYKYKKTSRPSSLLKKTDIPNFSKLQINGRMHTENMNTNHANIKKKVLQNEQKSGIYMS